MAHAELEHGVGDVRVRGVKLHEAAVSDLGIDVLLVFEIGVGDPQLRHEGNGVQRVFVPHAGEGLDRLLVVALLVLLEAPLVEPFGRLAHSGLPAPHLIPPGAAAHGRHQDQQHRRRQEPVPVFHGVSDGFRFHSSPPRPSGRIKKWRPFRVAGASRLRSFYRTLSTSAFSRSFGTSPITLSTTLPSLNRSMVGMLWIP